MTYRIAVLGPIPRDEITTHAGAKLKQYGCVLYTTAVLSALMGNEGEIVPVSNLRHTGSYLRRVCDIASPHRRCLHDLGGYPLWSM